MCSDPVLAVPGVDVVILSPPSPSHCKLFQHRNLTGAKECSKLLVFFFSRFVLFGDAILASFKVEMGAEDRVRKAGTTTALAHTSGPPERQQV